jgi:hypothetical protein
MIRRMAKKRAKKLEQWVAGRNPLLAVTTAGMLGSAEEMAAVLRLLAQGGPEVERMKPFPPAAMWMKLYRRRRTIAAEFTDAQMAGLFGPHRPSEVLWPIWDLYRVLARESEAERKAAVEELGQSEDGRRALEGIGTIIMAVLGKAWGEVVDPNLAAAAAESEFGALAESGILQFYICVWVPCVLLAQDYPGRLLRRARLGDLGALEHLLRIDKTVITDPRIAGRLLDASRIPRRARFQRLARAFAGKPQQLSPKAVKVRMAAFISRVHEQAGGITEPELRDLCDALQSARTKGAERIDSDLPQSREALAKAIQRHRKSWEKILPKQPDTNRK